MNRRIVLLAVLGLSLTGCGDKPKPAEPLRVAPPPRAATPEATPTGTEPAPPPAAVSQAAAISAIQNDVASSDPEVYLKRLTELLNAWVMSRNSFPANLDEFVKAKMIPKLPVPPPGKKLAIDQKGMRVVLADQ